MSRARGVISPVHLSAESRDSKALQDARVSKVFQWSAAVVWYGRVVQGSSAETGASVPHLCVAGVVDYEK